jgi:hypothetical protein
MNHRRKLIGDNQPEGVTMRMRSRYAAVVAAFGLVLTGAGVTGCAAGEDEQIVNPGGGEGEESDEGEGGDEEDDGY